MFVRNAPFVITASSILSISLAFGLAITAFAYGTAGYSGGHLNPAVTTSLMILGEIKPKLGALYICAQCLGLLSGHSSRLSLILSRLDLPSMSSIRTHAHSEAVIRFLCRMSKTASLQTSNRQLRCVSECCDKHMDGHGHGGVANRMWGQAIIVEVVGTYMLVMTVCWTAVSRSLSRTTARRLQSAFRCFAPPAITNCSINPARSFGAASRWECTVTPWAKDPKNDEAWEQSFLLGSTNSWWRARRPDVQVRVPFRG